MRHTAEQISKHPVVDETCDWLDTASIKELNLFLRRQNSAFLTKHAERMLKIRIAEAAREPHWTIKAAFWVALLAVII
jgi:hypothetical protein